MTGALVCVLAVLLDFWLGEPRRAHPLAAFGRFADGVEARLRAPSGRMNRLRGLLALAVCVLPFALLAGFLASLEGVGEMVEVLLLYLAIGAASLGQHARAVAAALAGGDLAVARARVQWMVSRDASALDREGVARAAVESVLENGSDAVFAALFWYLVLGAPGVVAYRLVNTLDAMWGYRTPRFRAFGWATARLDDGLNWVPARLTALTYALLGDTARALRCWRAQGRRWESPNAGVVMATGAGSLGLTLGGPAVYGGEVRSRPVLGEGLAPGAADIARAVRLVNHGIGLWLAVVLAGGVLLG